MRAIVLEKFGGLDSLVYKDIPEPEPKAGHVVMEPNEARGKMVVVHAEGDVRRLAIPAEEHVLREPSAHNRT